MKKRFGNLLVVISTLVPLLAHGSVPFITVQPLSQTNSAGTTATFSVTASSTSPVSYQWNFDNTNIPDATNSILILTNLQPGQAGNYAVSLSNNDGSTNSTTASLTVYSAPLSLFFDDFSGTNLNTMWTASLPDAYCGSFPNGYPEPALYVGAPNFGFQTVDGSSVIRLTNTLAPLERCGWSSATNFVTGDFRYDVRFNTLIQSPTTSIDGFLEIWIIDATNDSRYDIVSPFGGWYDAAPYFFVGSTIDNTFNQTPLTYNSNTWYHLVLEGAAGQNIRASILTDDGTEIVGKTLAHGAEAYGSGFRIALSQVIGGAGSPYPVDVAVDYASLTTGSTPIITTQPASQIASTGGNATFTVSAAGSPPLTHQWFFNGSSISDATNDTLVLTNIQSDQAGAYFVEVANSYGAAFSSNAFLNTGSAPVINNQPATQSVAAGGDVTFNVNASGAYPLQYQWLYNGSNLPGATNSSLQLTNVQFSQTGEYSVLVANAFGSLLSSNAELTVQSPPFIRSQPTSKIVYAGGTTSFSAIADGSSPLAYLWNCNGTNIYGATNSTLILTNVQVSQAGIYVLTVSNAFGGVWSSNAWLTVMGVKPVITNQPASQFVTYGGIASFSVTAGGTSPLNYQWAFDGTNIDGATNSTLVLADVQYSQGGNYSVVVSNSFGLVLSSNALLTVGSPLASSFFDDFSGTNLNPIWQTNLPNNAHCGSFPGGSSQTATYLGGPYFSLQTLGSNSVLRLTNVLSTLQRRGWCSLTNFGGTNLYYEVRFNTLSQSSTGSIDGFVEMWLIDAANSNRYDVISPFGGNYDGDPYFFTGSTIDNSYLHSSFTYSNYTWYRMVLQSVGGRNIRASILNDSGTELIGRTLSHGLSAFPSGFKIGISQVVGFAGAAYSEDVAIDYVSLATSYAPFITMQPADQVAPLDGNATFAVAANGVTPLTYQWSFNGTNIVGATNSVLALTNVQSNDAGQYSVAIANNAGSTNSSAATLAIESPLIITQQPQSQTVLSYSPASFTVAASGNDPVTYQWRKNGTNLVDGGNISGSTTATLTLASVSVSDAGNYDVVVTDEFSATNSSVAVLTVPETVMSLGSTNTMSGGTITVPVWMNAVGVENGFITSVSYDPAKLVLQSVTGPGVLAVYSQTNNGYVAFGVALSANSTFPAGSNEVADLIFIARPVTNLTTVNLAFTDNPDARQIADKDFNPLPAAYIAGTATLSPAEYEADVYPRSHGDSQVNIFDWLEIGRMVAGLDTVTNSDEFHRADCAPRNEPDGSLTVADWVQAGRYALGLDPLTLAVLPPAPGVGSQFKPHGSETYSRIVSVASVASQRGQIVNVPVELVCTTNENAVGLTINYNTNQLKLLSVTPGSALAGGRLNINSNQWAGTIGLALALSPGTSFAAGTNQLAILQFLAATNASGVAPITLNDNVVKLQVADLQANSLATAYVNGSVTLPGKPSVAVAASGGTLQLSWPLATGTFQVQTADSPAGPWSTIIVPVITNGANATVSVSPTNQQQYFRLQGQ